MQLSVVFVIAVTVFTASAQEDCDYSTCKATCADPDYSVDRCCGDCSYSRCQFEGCVSFGAFGPTWFPDKCTRCWCVDGQTKCMNEMESCPKRNCFGHPVRMGECCSECDFGVPEDRCGSVPIERRTEHVDVNGEHCRREVITYGCDKSAVERNGQWYACLQIPEHPDHNRMPEPASCADVKPRHVSSCEMIPGSKLADFGPPPRKYCIPV